MLFFLSILLQIFLLRLLFSVLFRTFLSGRPDVGGKEGDYGRTDDSGWTWYEGTWEFDSDDPRRSSGNAGGSSRRGGYGGYRGYGGYGGYGGNGGSSRGYGGYGGNGYPFQDNSAAVASAYRTLGVTPDASDSEVKSAYKRLALRFHPDRYASAGSEEQHSAEEQFKKVNEAYQVIKKKRGLD